MTTTTTTEREERAQRWRAERRSRILSPCPASGGNHEYRVMAPAEDDSPEAYCVFCGFNGLLYEIEDVWLKA